MRLVSRCRETHWEIPPLRDTATIAEAAPAGFSHFVRRFEESFRHGSDDASSTAGSESSGENSTMQLQSSTSLVSSAPPSPTMRQQTGDDLLLRLGMKLEAEDESGTLQVASVVDITDHGSLTVHFDGWPRTRQMTVSVDSDRLHPCGWATWTTLMPDIPNAALQEPRWYRRNFDWSDYLQDTSSAPVPACLLTSPRNTGRDKPSTC